MSKSAKREQTPDYKLYRAMLKAANEYIDTVNARVDPKWRLDLVSFGVGCAMSLVAREVAEQDPLFQAKLAKLLLCDLIPDAEEEGRKTEAAE